MQRRIAAHGLGRLGRVQTAHISIIQIVGVAERDLDLRADGHGLEVHTNLGSARFGQLDRLADGDDLGEQAAQFDKIGLLHGMEGAICAMKAVFSAQNGDAVEGHVHGQGATARARVMTGHNGLQAAGVGIHAARSGHDKLISVGVKHHANAPLFVG